MLDASSVGGCSQHTGEGLLRYRAEIDHGEAAGGQGDMKSLQCDTAFSVNI